MTLAPALHTRSAAMGPEQPLPKWTPVVVSGRKWRDTLFIFVARCCCFVALACVLYLSFQIVRTGLPMLSLNFITGYPSRTAALAGILPSIVGSIALLILTIVLAVPLALATAIYLEEYVRHGRITRFFELNLTTLAGTPSILFGLLGLHFFVRGAGLGRSILAASLTLSILVLPVLVTVAREALRQVPMSLREASWALGASRWQTIVSHVVPQALPNILTGCVLAFSRVFGETAPLLAIGVYAYVGFLPTSPNDSFTALPVQIFTWINRPQEEFRQIAAATILVLLSITVTMNIVALVLKRRFRG